MMYDGDGSNARYKEERQVKQLTKTIAIIGAGPGGYVAAIRGAQLGADIVLIENREVGGTCLNRGCIPTKTYFRNAEIMANLRNAAEFGISVGEFKLDGKALLERKDKIVSNLVKGIEQILGSYPNITLLRGTANIIDKNNIAVDLLDGGQEQVTVDNIVIATGSQPQMTETKGVEQEGVITSDDLLEMDVIPETLIVVGGGVIGLEFASIYQELGSQVILLASRILKDADKEISRRLTPMLRRQGIETYVDIRATNIVREGNKLRVTARYKNKDEEVEVVGDNVLIAVGRGPVLTGLNLDGLSVAYNPWGITVNENYETNVSGIYAIGDVNGGVQLAHVASAQGEYVVEKIMGLEPDKNMDVYPNCVFTMTEVADVGYTEEELKEKGIPYKVSKFNFAANGKALSLGNSDGLVKILAGVEDNKVLGVHILGPHANDLIAEGALAVANGLGVDSITRTIHAHPTLSEAFFEAALGIEERAIHVAQRRRRR